MADEKTLEPPNARRRRPAGNSAEDLVVEVVARHADGLLRLARRHSLCASDAEDAYQRGLEIFIRHAARLDPERAVSWLRTVVKHEAMAVRRSRQRDLAPAQYDFDAVEASGSPSPEEQVASFERVARSAEALGTLKPQEVRALWLRAQGNSYEEIQQQTGWTRTKVNRCLYEGRRAFLSRYAGIEAGEECRRWEPALSALVDGEASQEELLALRPHLRSCQGCRARVREIHRSSRQVAAALPLGLLAVDADQAEAAAHLALRAWEGFTAWMVGRAAIAVARAQAVVEALVASAGKGTAVIAAGAAIASGSTVVIEQAGTGSPDTAGRAGMATGLVAATGEALTGARRIARRQELRRAASRERARATTAPGPAGAPQPPAAPVEAGPAPDSAGSAAPQADPAAQAQPSGSGSEFGLE